MVLKRSLIAALMGAAVLSLAACAGDPTPRSTAEYSTDSAINTRVQAAVVGVPGIHANDIQVNTYEGVVSLKGKADNRLAAENAVQAARQVAGVKKVDFDIQVESP